MRIYIENDFVAQNDPIISKLTWLTWIIIQVLDLLIMDPVTSGTLLKFNIICKNEHFWIYSCDYCSYFQLTKLHASIFLKLDN